MSQIAIRTTQPEWWEAQQRLIQLLRDFDALQSLRRYLVPSSLAYRRLEREQARIEAAIAAARQTTGSR